MATNRRLVDEEQSSGLYPTPAWGTEALLKYVRFEGDILEPCCGEGDMAEVIKAAGYTVYASDLEAHGYGTQADFLSLTAPVANIITNPPFPLAEEIFLHAWKLAKKKVCLLLRTAFLESRRRYETIYSVSPPSRLLVFTERLSMYPKGSTATTGGTTSYSWFIWDKADKSGRTEITWIAPGLKPRIGLENQMELFSRINEVANA